jgi:hypothetical protein
MMVPAVTLRDYCKSVHFGVNRCMLSENPCQECPFNSAKARECPFEDFTKVTLFRTPLAPNPYTFIDDLHTLAGTACQMLGVQY